eukprot:1816590-Rhodomonas_salina.2
MRFSAFLVHFVPEIVWSYEAAPPTDVEIDRVVETRGISLRASYAMSGTDLAYGAMAGGSVLPRRGEKGARKRREEGGEGGEGGAGGEGGEGGEVWMWVSFPSICLCACYAMSGTAIAHPSISLRACYAMPGTDMANGTTGEVQSGGHPYLPTHVLCNVRYRPRVWCYRPSFVLCNVRYWPSQWSHLPTRVLGDVRY